MYTAATVVDTRDFFTKYPAILSDPDLDLSADCPSDVFAGADPLASTDRAPVEHIAADTPVFVEPIFEEGVRVPVQQIGEELVHEKKKKKKKKKKTNTGEVPCPVEQTGEVPCPVGQTIQSSISA